MKHRFAGAEFTGFGGNAPTLISGKNTSKDIPDELLNEIAKDCYDTFSFKTYGYCEAGFDGNEARFGIEPTYQFEDLKLIIICKNKEESRYITGRAVGAWASAIQQKTKEYGNYKKTSKFTRFVDKWYPRLFLTTISTNPPSY